MYETLFKDMESSFKPVLDVAEINRKTLEKLTSLQTECISDCVTASVRQIQALSTAADPQAALELQISFARDFEAKLANTAGLNAAAINEASAAIKAVVEQSLEGFDPLTSLNELFAGSPLTPSASQPAPAARPAPVKPQPEADKPAETASKTSPVAAAQKTETIAATAKPAARKTTRKKAAPKVAAAVKAAKKAPAKATAEKKAAPAAKPAAKKAATQKATVKKATQKTPAASPVAETKAAPQKPVRSKAVPTAPKAAPAMTSAPTTSGTGKA